VGVVIRLSGLRGTREDRAALDAEPTDGTGAFVACRRRIAGRTDIWKGVAQTGHGAQDAIALRQDEGRIVALVEHDVGRAGVAPAPMVAIRRFERFPSPAPSPIPRRRAARGGEP
jgi:hypothetical protein